MPVQDCECFLYPRDMLLTVQSSTTAPMPVPNLSLLVPELYQFFCLAFRFLSDGCFAPPAISVPILGSTAAAVCLYFSLSK